MTALCKVLLQCALFCGACVRKTLAVAMFNGERAPDADVGGSARRRRERRLRCFLHHEEMAVRMALARASHHAVQHHQHMATQTDLCACRDLRRVRFACRDLRRDSCPVTVAPAPVIEYVSSAPMIENIAPAPAVTFDAPSQRYTALPRIMENAVSLAPSAWPPTRRT